MLDTKELRPSNSLLREFVLVRLTEGISLNVVSTQNGWWQGCEELNIPGYDPYSSKGANVNLLYRTDKIDPISGSLPIKGHPCNIRKAE